MVALGGVLPRRWASEGPSTLQGGKGVPPPYLGSPPCRGEALGIGPRHPLCLAGGGTIGTFGGRRVRGLGGSEVDLVAS